MKKLLPLLLLLALPCAFAGCAMDTDFHEGDIAIRKVTYAVNGEKFDVTLFGDTEWDEFIVKLFDMVDEGGTVYFQCTSTTYEEDTTLDAKKPLSLKTANRDEAVKWASEKGKQGYVVIVTYDKKKKTYNCQALK